jgi:hypothetical protein
MNKTIINQKLRAAFLCGLLACGQCGAQSLVADYRFDNSATSAVGTPGDLQMIGSPAYQTEDVDGVNRRVLAFSSGNGCRLTNASQTLGDSYTIVVLFRFDSVTSWKRVIDFRNRKTDWGLYSYYGNLNFYRVVTGTGGAIQPDAYVQIALTRNAQGTVRGYVNGLPEIDFSDSGFDATLDSDNILSFFQDDLVVPNEHAAGAVSRIRIWDGPLGAQAIASLDRAAGSSSVSPPAITSAIEISVTSGNPVEYKLTASNNPISFSVTNLQPWMTFDAATGTLTGTAGVPGVYEIGVSAFNAGGSDSRTLRITVTPAVGSSLGFSSASVRFAETAGRVKVTVLRTGDLSGSTSISYFTSDNSAVAGVNYKAASGNINFAEGQGEKTVNLDLLWNGANESDKDFTLNLSDPVNAVLAQPSQLRIVIEDVPVPEVDFAVSAVVRWQSVAGAGYRVMWSNDLNATSWSVLRDNIKGTGSEIVVFDPVIAAKRFYRVELDL